MRAVGNFLLVEDVEEHITTKGGLLLTDGETKDMRYRKATILSCGNEVDFVDEGEQIYYDKTRSFTLMIEGTKTTVIRAMDIVVVL